MTGPAVPVGVCRACRAARGTDDTVLDLGELPPSDLFPAPGDPGPDPLFALSMWLCPACGLAQLTEDATDADEPRAVEPEALRRQAAEGVADVLRWPGSAGRPRTVTEFGSPHGGSWLGLFGDAGWQATDGPAELVVDCFGLMHEPDQRAGLRARVDRLAPGGVLLLLFHSLEAIVGRRQWSSLRHGHYAYWSATALCRLLEYAGLEPAHAWEYELYGGTVLLAARRPGSAPDGPSDGPDDSVARILAREAGAGLTDADRVRALQAAADEESTQLAAALDERHPVHAYGAASRAVSVLVRGGATAATVTAVADASPAKQGRCLPGSRIPIISPAELVRRDPDKVWLLLPDLLDEVSTAYPELAGRWTTHV